jgi:hypothetical protein
MPHPLRRAEQRIKQRLLVDVDEARLLFDHTVPGIDVMALTWTRCPEQADFLDSCCAGPLAFDLAHHRPVRRGHLLLSLIVAAHGARSVASES